jgi:signal peptidase II
VTRSRAITFGLVSAVIVLAADQASKYWILNVLQLEVLRQVVLLPVLNLTMVWNQGVTFGMLHGLGEWSHLALAGMALIVVGILANWLRRAETALVAISVGAIMGGAVGNVIDRLRYGAVVDFIHAHIGTLSWYVFNVADAAIVCGVGALVFDNLVIRRPKPSSDPGKEQAPKIGA